MNIGNPGRRVRCLIVNVAGGERSIFQTTGDCPVADICEKTIARFGQLEAQRPDLAKRLDDGLHGLVRLEYRSLEKPRHRTVERAFRRTRITLEFASDADATTESSRLTVVAEIVLEGSERSPRLVSLVETDAGK